MTNHEFTCTLWTANYERIAALRGDNRDALINLALMNLFRYHDAMEGKRKTSSDGKAAYHVQSL